MFTKKGYIVVGNERADEDTLLTLVTEAGAEDMADDGSMKHRRHNSRFKT